MAATTERTGKKTETEETGAIREKLRKFSEAVEAEKLANEVKSTTKRLRNQILPHAAAGSVFAAGLAEHAIAASGHDAIRIMATSAVASSLTALASWQFVKRKHKRWARRVLIAGLVSAGWLVVAPFGVGPENVAVLLGADAVLASAWWRVNRIGYPNLRRKQIVIAAKEASKVKPEKKFGQTLSPRPPADKAQRTIADWDKYVGCNGGPVIDSKIFNPTNTKYTVAFEGLLARGKQSFSTLLINAPRIASGLDTSVENLIFETTFDDMKDDGESASEARFKFQLVTNSPIRGAVNFDGPRRNGGTINVGPYADGSGEAPYRLYTEEGSMWSGVIIGGTGSGKSRLMENIVISAVSGGDTVVIYIDPQCGTSSPTLANNAHWFGTLDDSPYILEAVLAAMKERSSENALEGWTGFTPSPQRPGVLIAIDESHGVFEQDGTGWAKVAREGRKVGFALLAADQYPGLKTFGGEEALRSSVMEGNSFVLRSTSRQTAQLMPGLTVDPLSLPKIAGYAYVIGSEENGARTAPFRNRNTLPTHMEKQEGQIWLDKWYKSQPLVAPDTLVQTAFKLSAGGEAYESRAASETVRKDRSRVRIEALRNGIDPDEVGGGGFRAPMARKRSGGFVGFDDLGVSSFPSAVSTSVVRGESVYNPDDANVVKALTKSQQAVKDAIAGGLNRPSEIQESVDLSVRQVQSVLNELVDRGDVHKPKYGYYAISA